MSFTRQEQFVLIFIIATVLVGGVFSMIKQFYPALFMGEPELDVENGQKKTGAKGESTGQFVTPANANSSGKIDINSATAKDLETLPGIGPAMAERIIEYRNTYGKFYDIQEIEEVRGIGEKTYQKLEDLIVVIKWCVP